MNTYLSIKVNKEWPYKTLIILIILFIPVNLLKNLFPIPMTLINGGMILLVLLYLNVRHLNTKTALILMLTVIIFLLGLLVTDNVTRHFRYFINWISLILVLAILSYRKNIDGLYKAYDNNKRLFKRMIIICWVIVGTLLMIPSCYSGGWWHLSGGFVAFTVSHAVAAAVCTLGIFSLLLWYDAKHILMPFIMLLAAAYIILQTGARTYVLSIGFVFLYYLYVMIKKQYIKWGAFAVVLIACIFIIPNSSFAEKNEIVRSYQTINGVSLINALTSGRTAIWTADIKYFFSNGIFLFLFGNGFATSYAVNRIYYYGMDIFSHNLFIETLLSAGIVGGLTLLYLIGKGIKSSCINRKDKLLVLGYVVGIGFINGMIDSQIYCYSILIICLILKKNYLTRQ